MALPKSRASYRDVEAVLDTLIRLDQWPAEITCESHRAAVNWRARASHFRAYCRTEEETRLGLDPGLGTSAYDNLVMTLTPDGTTVIIAPRDPKIEVRVAGQAVSPIADRDLAEGEPIGTRTLGLEVDK